MIDNRKYLIIQTSDLDKVDFSQVLETSKDTVRKSIDGTKTFIKWENNEPDFLELLSNSQGPYSQNEIQTILNGVDWNTTQEN
jgi:hypothetical protein